MVPSAPGSRQPDGFTSKGSCAGSAAFRSRSVRCPARLPARPLHLRPLLAGGLHAASRPNAPCRQAARLGPAPGHSPSPSSDPRPPTKSGRGVPTLGGVPVVASMAKSKPSPKIKVGLYIVASLGGEGIAQPGTDAASSVSSSYSCRLRTRLAVGEPAKSAFRSLPASPPDSN